MSLTNHLLAQSNLMPRQGGGMVPLPGGMIATAPVWPEPSLFEKIITVLSYLLPNPVVLAIIFIIGALLYLSTKKKIFLIIPLFVAVLAVILAIIGTSTSRYY